MSEPTVIDAEFEETGAIQVNLEDRVKKLEGLKAFWKGTEIY